MSAIERAGLRIGDGQGNLGTATCPVCGCVFQMNTRRHIYCGPACSIASYSDLIPATRARLDAAVASVIDVVSDEPGLSVRGILVRTVGKSALRRLAIQLAIENGAVDRMRDGDALRHYPTGTTAPDHQA